MPRSEARWRGLSDPACALPQRQPPRPLPAPSQSAPPTPEPRSAVIHTQTASAVPTPSKFGGGGGVPGSSLSPFQQPTPARHCGPGFKAASHLDFIFTASPSPAFYCRSGKGFLGPKPGISHYREGEDGYLGALRLSSPTSCHFQTTPHSKLGFKLFASCLSGVGATEKVICQDNRIHTQFQVCLFVCLFLLLF